MIAAAFIAAAILYAGAMFWSLFWSPSERAYQRRIRMILNASGAEAEALGTGRIPRGYTAEQWEARKKQLGDMPRPPELAMTNILFGRGCGRQPDAISGRLSGGHPPDTASGANRS